MPIPHPKESARWFPHGEQNFNREGICIDTLPEDNKIIALEERLCSEDCISEKTSSGASFFAACLESSTPQENVLLPCPHNYFTRQYKPI